MRREKVMKRLARNYLERTGREPEDLKYFLNILPSFAKRRENN
jgi:hypothetical protein